MPRAKKSPSGMPVTDAKGAEREMLAQWWKERVQDIERIYQERIEVMRNVGEHPSPIFARIVRMDGALGMPKSLLAKKLGITVSTLMMHYGDEYDMGATEILSQVAANMLRIGTSQCDPAAATVGMKILDRRGGEAWAPPVRKIADVSDANAAPIIDSSKLNPEEREQLRQMLSRIAEAPEDETEAETDA